MTDYHSAHLQTKTEHYQAKHSGNGQNTKSTQHDWRCSCKYREDETGHGQEAYEHEHNAPAFNAQSPLVGRGRTVSE